MNRQSHYSTPKKARIRGTIDYLESRHIPHFKSDVFRFHGASQRSGWRALAEPEDTGDRSFHSICSETRGRKRKLTAGLDIDVSGRTVRRAVQSMDFRILKERRVEYSRVMLEKYPDAKDWRHIRFSDECHFGWGPQGRVHVIRRPWERHCPDCILEKEMPAEKDQKRLHCWAAVGYDFKSPLVWYGVPGNSNGKMAMQVYRDHILEPVVGGWLREGQSFSNIVRAWKEQNGLESFFNCAQSPNFSPIEKAWQGPKQYVKKRPCWDDELSMPGLQLRSFSSATIC
ncbi:hypothetical protein N657DRAFT_660760 [Parathielavia appendiculata]|uniref:Uncharacterized protein n=1 Tax=Parathielavia appendiculata TaxID=2587402 RepID=A0AAN6Z880_9PEZI|nr:hypothetical protein N657DRAFT_660760 [Parathielavia appendiculata]